MRVILDCSSKLMMLLIEGEIVAHCSYKGLGEQGMYFYVAWGDSSLGFNFKK